MSYAKLFSSITESSLWSSPKETRLLFVSMLARADAVGFVEASAPGLARLSNLTTAETSRGLKELESPDVHDKSGNHDGRRIVKVQGGWTIVNYDAYRNRRDEEGRREYMREYMQKYRKATASKHSVKSVSSRKLPLAKAEAEAEAEEREGEPARAQSVDEKREAAKTLLQSLGAIMAGSKGDLTREWISATKGLSAEKVANVFKAATPGIQWPSEFKAWRASRGSW